MNRQDVIRERIAFVLSLFGASPLLVLAQNRSPDLS